MSLIPGQISIIPDLLSLIVTLHSENQKNLGIKAISVLRSDVFMVSRPQEELYDCRNDPMQLSNLASMPQYRSELNKMRQVLGKWRRETKDNSPQELTRDWFDRETGKRLDQDRQIRGEMPGVKSDATEILKVER